MNLSIKTVIKIYDEIDIHILNIAISPENITMPKKSGIVTSTTINDVFITKIEGKMSIGRLINTMDDVIKTAILAKNILDTNNHITS